VLRYAHEHGGMLNLKVCHRVSAMRGLREQPAQPAHGARSRRAAADGRADAHGRAAHSQRTTSGVSARGVSLAEPLPTGEPRTPRVLPDGSLSRSRCPRVSRALTK